jgi:hypothetical protein
MLSPDSSVKEARTPIGAKRKKNNMYELLRICLITLYRESDAKKIFDGRFSDLSLSTAFPFPEE